MYLNINTHIILIIPTTTGKIFRSQKGAIFTYTFHSTSHIKRELFPTFRYVFISNACEPTLKLFYFILNIVRTNDASTYKGIGVTCVYIENITKEILLFLGFGIVIPFVLGVVIKEISVDLSKTKSRLSIAKQRGNATSLFGHITS